MKNRFYPKKYFFQTTQVIIIPIFLGIILLGSISLLEYNAHAQTVEKKFTENIKTVTEPEKMQIEAPSGNVYIGSTVTFSGQYLFNGKPAEDVSIAIIDKSNKQVIGVDSTNSKGMFSIGWTPKNIGTYEIYARTPADLIEPSTSSSNTIFVNVVFPPPKYLLNLSVSALSDQGKNNIEFFGSYTVDKKPLNGYPIKIHDKDTDELITETITDYQGEYSVNGNVLPRSNTYQFYAISWDPIESIELHRSNIVQVTVKQIPKSPEPTPEPQTELILNTLPSKVVEGDLINITGYVTSQGFTGNRVFVKINGENTIIDKINTEGEFSKGWNVTNDYIGFVRISAECLCDGKNLQSSTQIIDVEPMPVKTPPLKVKIISSTSSGLAPLDVKFESMVSGGTPPYEYTWDLGNGHTSSKEYLEMEYTQDGNYMVSLAVTDSSENNKQAFRTINVKEEVIKLPEPQVLIYGSTVEGSSITFVADGNYPEKVNSYKWTFDDGTIFSGKEISHVFRDDGSHGVELSVVDVKDSTASVRKEVKISNASPKIIEFTADKYKADTNETIQLRGEFSDVGLDDVHTVELYVNGKPTILEDKFITGSFVQNQKFESPGDYTIKLLVTDDDEGKISKELHLQINEFPWLFLGLGISAAASIGGLATKSLLISQTNTGKIDLIESQQSDALNSNENEINENQVMTSNVEIEVNWGFEK